MFDHGKGLRLQAFSLWRDWKGRRRTKPLWRFIGCGGKLAEILVPVMIAEERLVQTVYYTV